MIGGPRDQYHSVPWGGVKNNRFSWEETAVADVPREEKIWSSSERTESLYHEVAAVIEGQN